MLPIAILCGGLATRLRPVTETVPKSLISIHGEPFIHYQLRYLYDQGIRDVVLCVGYLGHMIEGFVGDGKAFGLNVKYSYDGDKLLGTGGAINKALTYLGEDFFVMYGDSYLPINFNQVETAYFESKKVALMTILENSGKWDKSNVIYQNGEILEYNKRSNNSAMHYIDYGLSILSSSIIKVYNINDHFDLSDLYHELSIMKKMAGFIVSERFYEIGSFDGISDLEKYLKVNEE
jgi:NDP-sugar pyrophosphorylase family protein